MPSKEYGVKAGKVIPYSDEDQLEYLNKYNKKIKYLDPLKQKKLNPIKHRIPYEKKLFIKLQEHQKDFVISFLNDHLQGALLFHSVGSGKTLTAVVFSHYYLTLKPTHNVCIISPPSLLFNFVEALKQYGLDIRDNRYKFETYEKFAKNPNLYVNDKTLLIVDEAHNFRTFIEGAVNRTGQIIMQACSKADKVLAMTGTPFVNGSYDIENIMAMVSKRGNQQLSKEDFEKVITSNDTLHDYFDYRISYFDVMDTDAKKYFPSVSIKYVPITLENEKDKQMVNLMMGSHLYGDIDIKELKKKVSSDYNFAPQIIKLLTSNKYDEETGEFVETKKESTELKSFYSAGRQVTNIIAKSKFKYIIKKIQRKPHFKTIIYSVFMENALLLLKKQLTKYNFNYVEIDGTISATKRQSNLNLYNQIDSDVNILLISKAGTEGVSTFGTRQIFIMESQWNPANSEQAIARAIRFKSHMHLPKNERHVQVYRLITAITNDDVDICNKLNDAVITSQTVKYGELKITVEVLIGKLIKQILKKLKLKTIDEAWEPYYKKEYDIQIAAYKQKRSMFRKKPPFNFKRPSSTDMIMTIIKETKIKDKPLTDDKHILKTFNELTREKKQITTLQNMLTDEQKKDIQTKSPDILLEFISLRKKYDIDQMIGRMFKSKNNIKQVEDYDDKTTRRLKRAIEGGEDIEEVIEYQQTQLQKRVKSFLKYSEVITDMFINKDLKPKANKDGEELQEFHTPEEFADELISYSNILTNPSYKKHNLRILEPTAGYGSLVKAVIKARQQNKMNKGYTIEMIEYSKDSRKVLNDLIYDKKKKERLPGILSLQEQNNFLSYISNELYDVIIMNPPFHLKKRFSGMKADVWDGDFIARAYSLLKPGGEILAIATNMITKLTHNTMTRKKKTATTFEGLSLDTFVKPPLSTIEIMKEYKAHKWTPKEGKGGKLTLTFTMYKITKPIEEDDIPVKKSTKKEPKKEPTKKYILNKDGLKIDKKKALEDEYQQFTSKYKLTRNLNKVDTILSSLKPTHIYNKIKEDIRFVHIRGITLLDLENKHKKIENIRNKLNDMTIEHISLMRPYFIRIINENLERIQEYIARLKWEETLKEQKRQDNRR